MKLELKDGYVIRTLDVMNLGLCKTVTRVNKETKEEYEDEVILGYHSTIYTALRSYFTRRVSESESDDLHKLIKLHEDIMEEMKRIGE